jgi:hypothetical protein
VRGAPDGAAATALVPERLRVRRRRGAVVATFVAGGTRAQVEQRRSRRGRALARTGVRTRPGRAARVRVRLRQGARYVAVRTMGTRSSRALVRRVPEGRR